MNYIQSLLTFALALSFFNYPTYSSTRLSQCLSFQVTISGVFRGVGKQYLAAIINFLCYSVLGLSVGVPLALKDDLGTIGLWSGLAIGNVIQVKTILWNFSL